MQPVEFLRGLPAALALVLMFLIPAGARAQAPALQFKFEAYTAKESALSALITVVRLGSTNEVASVDFATLNTAEAGTTATPDVDYLPTNGTLSFAPGVKALTFNVPLRPDAEDELNELVTLELSNPVGAVLGGQANATLTITDDDICAYTLAPAGRTHGPEGGAAEFIVNATAGCRWTVTEAASWLSVITSSGTGTLSVIYSVDPNPLPTQRSAAVKVAGKSFTVTQRGVPPPDLTKPAVTITAPTAGARITNLPFTVTGKASDAGGVSFVEYRIENVAGTNDWTPADGTTNWTANVDGLVPGLNTLRIRAYDTAGNYASNGVTRSFTFVMVSPIRLGQDGDGTGIITGASDGQFLDVGRTYTITAVPLPAKSSLFLRWEGSIETNTPKLTFTMRTNLSLYAIFKINPFPPLKGPYNGFVSESGPTPRFETVGNFTATLTDLGAFTAKLILGRNVHPLSGRFDPDGYATNIIQRPGLNPLTVLLVASDGFINGSVTDGNWFSNLAAERAAVGGVTNSPPAPGRYRVLFTSNYQDPASAPNGTSYATATVDALGRVNLVATLADGTVFSQGTLLSQSQRFPMFSRLYGGAGLAGGWVGVPQDFFVTFGDGGYGIWYKSPFPGTRFYTNGFAAGFNFLVTRYVASAVPSTPFLGTPPDVSYSGGQVVFSGGNIGPSFTNVVRVDPGNKIVNLGTTDGRTNRLTLAYNLSGGNFSGTVTVPGTVRSISYKGSLTGGFFLGSNECGRVLLQAAP
jgi:hypothetical protein